MTNKIHPFPKGLLLLMFASVFSLLNTSCIVKSISAVTYHRSAYHAPYDAVIVPGNPYEPHNTNLLFKARVLWAKALFERGITRNIIFSGSAVHTPYEEALVMKMIAQKMGIPCEHIFIERKAERSTENIKYGKELAAQLGFEKVAVATDPFQMIYLSKYMKHNAPEMAKLPISMDSLKNWYLSKPQLPAIKNEVAYVENFVPLRDKNQ